MVENARQTVLVAYERRTGEKCKKECPVLAQTDNFAVTHALAANETLMNDFYSVLHKGLGNYVWKTNFVDLGLEFAKELETYGDFSKVTVRDEAKGLVSREQYLALFEKYDELDTNRWYAECAPSLAELR
jgi:hypothetical protein